MADKVEMLWENGKERINYKFLDSHCYYSTNFQNFLYKRGNLCFINGNNAITILGVIK